MHFCFVDFPTAEQAVEAMKAVRRSRATIKGCAVRVNMAFGDNGKKKARDREELDMWRGHGRAEKREGTTA